MIGYRWVFLPFARGWSGSVWWRTSCSVVESALNVYFGGTKVLRMFGPVGALYHIRWCVVVTCTVLM